jgi:hypothetical protein
MAVLIACGAALLGLAQVAFAAPAAAPSPFDAPLKVVRVALPPDRDNPQARPKVSCFYFPRFLVKEIDLGEVGAAQLSILPLAAAPAKTPCRQQNSPGERVVAPTDWTGYFDGVRGGYVIFSAEDGWNGGMGFAVFSAATGKKVFDDAVKTRFEGLDATSSGLKLRYLRVYAAKCSLIADRAGCWQAIRQATGLTSATAPGCAALYAREAKRTPSFAAQVRNDPTVIDYPVTVTVEGAAAKITPASGKANACRPAD